MWRFETGISKFSFIIGVMVMAAISLICVAMLYEIYILRDLKARAETELEVADISREALLFFAGVIIIVILSFFDPLWFVL